MSEQNEAVSEKSHKSKDTAAGPSHVSVSHRDGSRISPKGSMKVQEHNSPKVPKSRRAGSDKKRKSQMPSKKRSGGNGFVLSKEDIYYLKTHTRYDEKEIK